jgi:hypothetical protein
MVVIANHGRFSRRVTISLTGRTTIFYETNHLHNRILHSLKNLTKQFLGELQLLQRNITRFRSKTPPRVARGRALDQFFSIIWANLAL